MDHEISGHTELTGLFASPVRHSSSPKMQTEAFRSVGIDCVYLAFEVDNSNLADAVQSVRALGMRGVNISMPNKTVVHKYLDHLSPAAELCGAVNTVVNENGVLTGHITDGIGYVQSLRDFGFEPKGQKFTVLGAGGAGTAIAIQLALDGAREISIFNIHDKFWENAKDTARKIIWKTDCRAKVFDLYDTEHLREEIAASAVLANATSVGMKPLEGQCPIPDASLLRPDLIVTDAIYSPPETPLLKMAREIGCRAMNGLPMMLFQGDAAFQLWTGKPMNIEHMKKYLGI